MESNFLEAANLQTLSLLNSMNERAGVEKTFRSSCIEPGDASTEWNHLKVTTLHVLAMHVGDFQFATTSRLERRCDVNDIISVDVQTRYRQI